MGVKCPKCNTDNPDTQKFCGECATPLPSQKEIPVTETLETPKEELTTGSTFAGRYQIIEVLGKGGMGKVYRALDKKLNEEVALKLIKPEIASDKKTLERFNNELKFARKIAHKNVGRMYELMEEKGTHFITMEYVPGQDLRGLIRQTGQLTVGTAVSIAKQMCEGLTEAHRLGVIHRDLKPQNIMIDKEGNARIMDFGIARSLRAKGITGSGVMIGTPEYMSPEQVDGKDADQRADIYSLGVILYEMVTGQVPFEGDTPFSIGVKQKSEIPRPPKEINEQIPEDLNRVILRCMEKEKESRYQSVGELHSELMNLEKGIPTTERIVPERKPLTSREITVQFSLKKLFIPTLIVIAIAIIGVIIWQLLPQKEAVLAPKIENSIAVISFKNQTGDPAYDYLQEVIPNLLITNLENTGLFYVATWERMQDILKQMGVKQTPIIESDLGFELCRRAGIKAIAIGTFSMAGDVFTTDVKVLDAETKDLLKGVNTKGKGADSILESQINELSRDISLALGAGMDKVEAAQLNIKDITTQSLQAYEYFLKGKEACNSWYWEDTKKNLEKALEIDPTFAMAYVYLAWAYFELGEDKAGEETIEKAMAFSDKTSQKDRLYLEALYAMIFDQDPEKPITILNELIKKYPEEKWALHMLGDFLRSTRSDFPGAYAQFEKWLELDPQDANAINHLISVSIQMRDWKKAEEFIKMYEAVAPPDAANLLIQAEMYIRMGQVDKAIAKNREALEIQPDLFYALGSLAYLYYLKEDYEEAMKWANEFVSRVSSPGMKSNAYHTRGRYHYWGGSYNDALGDFTLAEKMADEAESRYYKYRALVGKGYVYLAKKEFELSQKSFGNALKISLKDSPMYVPNNRAYIACHMGILALEQGDISSVNARLSELMSLLPEIKAVIEDKVIIGLMGDLLQGEVLLAQGSLDAALVAGQRACGPESPYWKDLPPYLGRYWSYYIDLIARIYAERGDVGQAIQEYERLFKMSISGVPSFLIHPLYHYRLGLLYERANEAAKAKAQYEKFLDLWKDADPGIAEVEDARKRLAGLKSQ